MSPRLLLLVFFSTSSISVLQSARFPSDNQCTLVRMRECKYKCWPDIYPTHKTEATCDAFKRDVLFCCGNDVDFRDACPSHPRIATPCLQPQPRSTHFWDRHPLLWTICGFLLTFMLFVFFCYGLIRCGFTTAGNVPLRDLPAYEAGNQLCWSCLSGCNICSGFGVNNNVTVGLEPDAY